MQWYILYEQNHAITITVFCCNHFSPLRMKYIKQKVDIEDILPLLPPTVQGWRQILEDYLPQTRTTGVSNTAHHSTYRASDCRESS